MNINVSVTLTDIKGEAIKTLEKVENPNFIDSESTPGVSAFIESKKPLTLRDCCVNALLAPVDGDKKLKGIEKFQIFKLAERIQSSDDVQISAEEIGLIKKRISQVYANLIVGRSYELLEQE